jgi:REP element-mobilizing transposase RayT
LQAAWETDGLRKLEHKWSADLIQFTFSVRPRVSPVFFAGRVKGRLQHCLRKAGLATALSRKVAVRTIGANHRAEVEAYIARQVEKEPLADPRFKELLRQFTRADSSVDLAVPTPTNSGRYWYNLHLVLVTQARYRIGSPEFLGTICDWSFKIAANKGHAISRLAVMPEHLHASLRGNIAHSPEEIALAFLNNLACCWPKAGVGTVLLRGYVRGIRHGSRTLAGQTASPAARGGRGR